MRRLPPLNSVRAFEAAVRLGSFTAAASELCVTQGAISHHIKLIEGFLEVELFKPVGRRLLPTEDAMEYATELRASLDRIERATKRISEPTAAKIIRVNALQTFATRWLIPRLPGFHSLHPGIEIRVVTSSSPLAQLPDPFDVAFRRLPIEFPGLRHKTVMNDFHLPVCSPAVLSRQPLNKIEDLEHHTLLCRNEDAGLWDRWLTLAGLPEDIQPRRLRFEKTYIALQAASEGLGLALAPIPLVAGDLARGWLVTPFLEPVVSRQPIEIFYPAPENGPNGVQTFVAWVLEQARTEPGGGAKEGMSLPARSQT